MRYHAPGLARGMALTGLSAVVWTAAWVATRSKKRLHPGTPLRHHIHFRRPGNESRASRTGSTPVRHHVKDLSTSCAKSSRGSSGDGFRRTTSASWQIKRIFRSGALAAHVE